MLRFLSMTGLCAMLALSGCTSTQTGAAVGAGTGALVGAAVTGTGRGAVAGAAIGGVAGALIGHSATPGQCVYRAPNGRRYTAPCK
jgi:hypothetical protein